VSFRVLTELERKRFVSK
jgi:hypothetical protein